MRHFVSGVRLLATSAAALATTSYSVTVIPLPSGFLGGLMQGINDSGQVEGFGNNGTTDQAFIGATSGSTAIPLPAGWTASYGFAVNASGQVAGYVYNGSYQAFIGTTSGSMVIPLPAGATQASANEDSLNDLGVVVGYSNVGGWIWDASDGTQLLNNLVPTGWNIDNGISISDSGLILATGTNDGGSEENLELQIVTTPEPGAYFLTGAGLLLLLAFARRTSRVAYELR